MAEDTDGLFGFQLADLIPGRRRKRKEADQDATENQEQKSFVPPEDESGTTVEASGSHYGYSVDFDATRVKSERELVTKYREAAQSIECDAAIEDIVNEAIISDTEQSPVSLMTEGIENERIKKVLQEEFETTVSLLNMTERAHDLFRRWYIDGRLYFHVIVDENDPKKGIKELRAIDAARIKKVRKVKKEKDEKTGVEYVAGIEEYFLYQDPSMANMRTGVKIHPDSIIYITSGILDPSRKYVQSFLHKALRAVNQLRMMEDSQVIYRLARAPERRIFYIDVGNLQKGKAEEYVSKIMAKHRNKLVYDASTGELKDERKHMNMLEDFWLPRREGGRGTEIDTLPGGQNLGEIEDIEYFRRKLYQSLNVPLDRLEQQNPFTSGRSQEISRDEVKFQKFIARLRRRFGNLLLEVLKRQMVLKGYATLEEWPEIRQEISIDYLRDVDYKEMLELEVLRDQMGILRDVDAYVGKYFSSEWVRKRILKQTDEDIREIDKQIKRDGDGEQDDDDGFGGRGF